MSQEVVNFEPEPSVEYGMTVCPICGFKIPDHLVVCWKCGKMQSGITIKPKS